MQQVPYAPELGHRITKMQVEQLIMVESGTYNPLYHRPYQSHLDAQLLNTVINRVDQAGTGHITGNLLSGVAGMILAPTATVDTSREIAIPHGWQERRIRFVLIVSVEFSLGTQNTYYYQGYTNYPGVNVSGAIDPQMVFIINSVMVVGKQVANYGPMGYTTMDRLVESYQVVADPTWHSITQAQMAHLMRPQDVFTGMQSNYMRGAADAYGQYDNGSSYRDARSVLRADPQRSNRANNLPGAYVAKVIDGFFTSSQMSEFGHSDADVLSISKQTVMETPISENPFIRWLGERRSQPTGYQFTMGDLELLDSGVSGRVNLIIPGQAQAVQQHRTGMTSFWNGADRATVVASHLVQAIPALMMELLITKIALRSTNHDIGGRISTVLISANSLTGLDLTRHYELFVRRLETEIIHDFTYGGQESYQLEIQADIFGETWVNLSIGPMPLIQYVAPSFCDNLFAPIVAQNQHQFDNLVLNMEQLVNNVNESVFAGHAGQAPVVNHYV
jgi:hypothetical protein